MAVEQWDPLGSWEIPFIEYRKILQIVEDPVWSGINNFAWPAEYIQMDTHSNTKILDPGFCFTVNSISGLLRYSNISRRRSIISFYMRKCANI
jgi:hypothetical protein